MDLKDRSIQKYLNRKQEVPDLGICDVVANKATLESCINSVKENFDVLFAGVEQIKYHKEDFVQIIDRLKNTYDYVIVDISSCDAASEAASIGDLCDEILFVVKWNDLSYNKINNAVKYMSFSDSHLMGYVLNQIAADGIIAGAYSYSRYYYSYGRRYGYARYGYGRYGHYGSHYGKMPHHRHMPASQLSISIENNNTTEVEPTEETSNS